MAPGGRWSASEGGGFHLYSSLATPSGYLLHNTIADNSGSGQGVCVGITTTLAFTNTIIAGHSVGHRRHRRRRRHNFYWYSQCL